MKVKNTTYKRGGLFFHGLEVFLNHFDVDRSVFREHVPVILGIPQDLGPGRFHGPGTANIFYPPSW